MKIKVMSKAYEIVYELNESKAAMQLYAQLPLTLEVKDFSTNEKTFYPPKTLDIKDAPLANAEKGTLAYYAPWADVVMFYDFYGKGSDLYALGKVVSGKSDIEKLKGTITIEVCQNS
ncbi:cyclophilin-like fold protein [Longicatena caecimuris]|uniref:cyclophilin-like fold protein n=1 Tax=Longicatena caecimuris TaxID=1796635 RepID=UPI0018AB2E9C|nr:cyclophilin-like fold protein [Longicatena caecimuris]